MAISEQMVGNMQTATQSISKAKLVVRGTQATWIDLGEYENFVMGNHRARETEEWFKKWTEYWKQIGIDDNVMRKSKL
ncbi:hypothetical protein MMC11_006239 [Xylographa trunciseda]|nr:hypothetical protein [Xylographa trunciseda]